MSASQCNAMRQQTQAHQVVTLLGARGTGKARVADTLCAEWEHSRITVVRLDGRHLINPEDIRVPFSEALRCPPGDLTCECAEAPVRCVIERCDALVERNWFLRLQEELRAALSAPAARGRVGLLLLGRPIFRALAGGAASPLLNAGPTLVTQPLGHEEIQHEFGLSAHVAEKVHSLTGGHPGLTVRLLAFPHSSPRVVAEHVEQFLDAHRRYVLRLIEDQSSEALGLLGTVLSAGSAVHRTALLQTRAAGRVSTAGIDTLADLQACGLVRVAGDGLVSVAARLLFDDEIRTWVRPAFAGVPVYAVEKEFQEAVRLLWWYENWLRHTIVTTLQPADDAWWPSRIPGDLVAVAEIRRTDELAKFPLQKREHPILYLSLGELFQLIQAQENWRPFFRLVFPVSLDRMSESVRVITTVRNRVAHNRPISEQHLAELAGAASRVGFPAAPAR